MQRNELYALSDNLQMSLTWKNNEITGLRVIKIAFGDLSIYSSLEVLASTVTPKFSAVLVRVLGDVGLVMSVAGKTIDCSLIDLDKVPKPQGRKMRSFFTAMKFSDAESLHDSVKRVAVARFTRKGVMAWQAV